MHLFPHGPQNRQRLAASAYQDLRPHHHVHRIRHVDGGLIGFPMPSSRTSDDHTNNLHPAIAIRNRHLKPRSRTSTPASELLPKRIALRPDNVGRASGSPAPAALPASLPHASTSGRIPKECAAPKNIRGSTKFIRESWSCNCGSPKISKRVFQPLEGGVALVEIPAATTS